MIVVLNSVLYQENGSLLLVSKRGDRFRNESTETKVRVNPDRRDENYRNRLGFFLDPPYVRVYKPSTSLLFKLIPLTPYEYFVDLLF